MSYRAPSIPNTPSSGINRVLQNHFTAPPDNLLKAIVAHFVCAQFNSILLAYKALKRGAATDSYHLWATACALVSLALSLASLFVYKVLMASTFILHGAILYGLGGLALLGIGMGVAGVVFFDRNKPDTSAATTPSHSPGKISDEKLGYETYRANTTIFSGGGSTTTGGHDVSIKSE